MTDAVQLRVEDGIARVTLNDAGRRNAMSIAMFDALDVALDRCADDDVRVLLLSGNGPAFCAGFDLAAAVDDPPLVGRFIARLSAVNRRLRRLPAPVVVAVHGAAIAGGCAVLGACDLVVVERGATLGYPVHALGISPAVTIPTLMAAIGSGPSRALLMGGALIDGVEAHRMHLASHLCEDGAAGATALELAQAMAGRSAVAVQATKAWLNELDGSLDDERFDGPVDASVVLAGGPGSAEHLQRFWAARAAKRREA